MLGARSSAGNTIPTECRVIEVRVGELRQLFNAIDPSPFRERDLDPRAEEFIVEWARDVPRDARLAFLVHRDNRFSEVIREGLLISGWVAMWRPLELFLYDWWPIRAEAHLFDRLSTMPVRIEYNETTTSGAWRDDWPAVPASPSRSQARPDHHGGLARTRTMSSDDTQHHHSPDEERQIREAALDQTIEGSFPASDPASSDPNPDDHSALEHQHPKRGTDEQGEGWITRRDARNAHSQVIV